MKILRNISILVVLSLMAILIIYPERYIASVNSGLQLFITTVLPALFPFFFFSKILLFLDITSPLEKMLAKPMQKTFNSPPISGYIFVISLLGGYPMGAKLVYDCYKQGLIDEYQAKNISVFASTSGPLFILGSIAMVMFQNKIVGLVILLSHYLATIINGLIWVDRKNKNCLHKKKLSLQKTGYENILGDSIVSSLLSVAIVGGYIAIFCMLVDVCIDFKIVLFFEKLLSYIKIPSDISNSILVAFIEVTSGCKKISLLNYPLVIKVPICASMISFGGLSVTFQSLAFLANSKIKASFYLAIKFSQAVIAYIIATVLGWIIFV